MSGGGGATAPSPIQAVLVAAIARGAPLYNAGDIAGCVTVYRNAARDGLALPGLPQEQADRLRAGVGEAELSRGSPTECAWALRRMIDDVLVLAQHASDPDAAALALFRVQILGAIGAGVPLYNSGDISGCTRTYTEVCQRLIAEGVEARPLPERLRGVISQALTAIEGPSTDERQKAWMLRHALDSVLASLSGGSGGCNEVFDASKSPEPWASVNDGVMGGRSQGAMTIEGGVAVFAGVLSTDNNGGFSSVRGPALHGHLPDARGVSIECRGDGQRYKVQCRTHGGMDGMTYQADFTPKSDAFETVNIPFRQFNPTFRGSVVANAPALEGHTIKSFGLMNSKLTDLGFKNPDFRAGPFRLEVKRITTF